MNTQEIIKALSDLADTIKKDKDTLVQRNNYDAAEILIYTITSLKLIINKLQYEDNNDSPL